MQILPHKRGQKGAKAQASKATYRYSTGSVQYCFSTALSTQYRRRSLYRHRPPVQIFEVEQRIMCEIKRGVSSRWSSILEVY